MEKGRLIQELLKYQKNRNGNSFAVLLIRYEECGVIQKRVAFEGINKEGNPLLRPFGCKDYMDFSKKEIYEDILLVHEQ